MPIFIASLIGGLVQAAGTLVGRVLLSLGIGYLTYTGVDASLAWVRDQVVAASGGLPGQTLAVLGALRAGSGLSVVFSALAARLVLSGLTSGSIKRMVLK
jgi:hypothetical protein